MRLSLALACSGVFAAAAFAACIPHPQDDYDDYVERVAPFQQSVDAGAVDTGPPPTQAIEGLYYGACLPQLAFGDPEKVFNFYTNIKFTPDPAGGGKLVFRLSALRLSPARTPPDTVSQAGITGGEISSGDPPAPNVDPATSKFDISLGTVNVPGDANPLSGSAVNIENAGLKGAYASGRFCTLLRGNVTSPVTLTLEPEKNICYFIPIKDGDATPKFTPQEFQQGACPSAL